jgi:predicted DNA-binding transcriptional regulator AlpA
MAQRLYRMAQLATTPKQVGILPVSPATLWRWVAQGRFPAPFHLGSNTTVWEADKIEQFLAQRAAG